MQSVARPAALLGIAAISPPVRGLWFGQLLLPVAISALFSWAISFSEN